MPPEKERKREKDKNYFVNSIKQMRAYEGARLFFQENELNDLNLLRYAIKNRVDFTDVCMGAINSVDKDDFVNSLRSITISLLDELTCDAQNVPYILTRKTQLEIIRNSRQNTKDFNTNE